MRIEDLGLMMEALGPGEGVGDPRSKGLVRHRALPGAVVDMVATQLRFGRADLYYETVSIRGWKHT